MATPGGTSAGGSARTGVDDGADRGSDRLARSNTTPYEIRMAASSSQAPKPAQTSNEKICVGCADVAPPAGGDTTLISIGHGWRILRGIADDGRSGVEWCCPTCWADYRAHGPARGRRRRSRLAWPCE